MEDFSFDKFVKLINQVGTICQKNGFVENETATTISNTQSMLNVNSPRVTGQTIYTSRVFINNSRVYIDSDDDSDNEENNEQTINIDNSQEQVEQEEKQEQQEQQIKVVEESKLNLDKLTIINYDNEKKNTFAKDTFKNYFLDCSKILTYAPINNPSNSWFDNSELINQPYPTYNDELLNMWSIYINELMYKIRTAVESTNDQLFIQNFNTQSTTLSQRVQVLFESLNYINKSLDLDKIHNYELLIDWLILCYVNNMTKNKGYLNIFFYATQFFKKEGFEHYLFKKCGTQSSLIWRYVNCPNIIQDILKYIEPETFLEIINKNDKLIIDKMFIIGTIKEIPLNEKTIEFFTNYRTLYDMTIMHMLFVFSYNDTKTIISETQPMNYKLLFDYFKDFLYMINIKDSNNLYPTDILRSTSICNYLLEKQYIKLTDLTESKTDTEYLPPIYNKYTFETITKSKLIDNLLNPDLDISELSKNLGLYLNAYINSNSKLKITKIIENFLSKLDDDKFKQLLESKFKLNQYNDIYPMIGIIGMLNYLHPLLKQNIEKPIYDSKFEIIKEQIIKYPFLLPFNLNTTKIDKHNSDIFKVFNICQIMIESEQYEYLTLYLKHIFIDKKIDYNKIASDETIFNRIFNFYSIIVGNIYLDPEYYSVNNYLLVFIDFILDFNTNIVKKISNVKETGILDIHINLIKPHYEEGLEQLIKYIYDYDCCKELKRLIEDYNLPLESIVDNIKNQKEFFLKTLYADENILLNILEKQKIKLKYTEIFGKNIIDDIINYNTKYNKTYKYLCDNGYLDNFAKDMINITKKLLTLGNTDFYEHLVTLPNIDESIVFNIDNDLDVLYNLCENQRLDEFIWILNKFKPDDNYKKLFIEKLNKELKCPAYYIYPLLSNGFYSPHLYEQKTYVNYMCNLYKKFKNELKYYAEENEFNKFILETHTEIEDYVDLVKCLINFETLLSNLKYIKNDKFIEISKLILEKESDIIKFLKSNSHIRQIFIFDIMPENMLLNNICDDILINHIFRDISLFELILESSQNIEFILKNITDTNCFDILKNQDSNSQLYILLSRINSYNKDKITDIMSIPINNDLSLYEITTSDLENYKDPIREIIYNIYMKTGLFELLDDKLIQKYITPTFMKNNLTTYNEYLKNKDKSIEIYSKCPQLLLLNPDDIPKYANKLDEEHIIELLESDLLTEESQDMLLNNIPEKTVQNLFCIIKYLTPYVFNKKDIILKMMVSEREIMLRIVRFIMEDINRYDSLKEFINNIDEYGDYIYATYFNDQTEITERFVKELKFEDIMQKNKKNIPRLVYLQTDSIISKFMMQREDIKKLFEENTEISKIIFTNFVDSFIVNNIFVEKNDIYKKYIEIDENIRMYKDYLNRNFITIMFGRLNDLKNNSYIPVYEFNETKIKLTEMKTLLISFFDNLKTHNYEELKNMIHNVDLNGNNLLFNLIKYECPIYSYMAKLVYEINSDLLTKTNLNNMTLLAYAYSLGNNNIDIVNSIIQDKDNIYDEKQNYLLLSNNGSALCQAVLKYDDNDICEIKKLIKWKHFDKETIIYPKVMTKLPIIMGDMAGNMINIFLSPIQIACYKSPEIFKLLMKTYNDNRKILVSNKITLDNELYELIDFAYLYSPNSFHYLLDIFNNEKLPKEIGIMGIPIVNIVNMSKIQPYSWFIFAKNNTLLTEYLEYHKITSNNLNELNELNELYETYNLPYELSINNLDKMAHYIQTTHEMADHNNVKCKICEVGKSKILFGCKKHMTCVACSYRENVCPFCRCPSDNKKKIKIFD